MLFRFFVYICNLNPVTYVIMKRKSSTLRSVPRGTKSALTPVAQSSGLLPLDPGQYSDIVFFRSRIYELTMYPLSFRVLLSVLLDTGGRISEVLRLRSVNVNLNFRVSLKASKGSADRIMSVRPYPNLTAVQFKACFDEFGDYSRFYVYRVMKAHGLYLLNSEGGNRAVTHAPRHLLASEVVELSNSEELAGKVLGHKSKNSIKYYLNEEGKTRKNNKPTK